VSHCTTCPYERQQRLGHRTERGGRPAAASLPSIRTARARWSRGAGSCTRGRRLSARWAPGIPRFKDLAPRLKGEYFPPLHTLRAIETAAHMRVRLLPEKR